MLNVPDRLRYLILFTAIVRLLVASALELSNDEVYYYLYALDLQPNYFDHPPGVGILIRIFTGNLLFTNELFVRLGAIICAALGTIISYNLGALMKNERTGWFAAILYNTSVYTSIIAGTFVIPDSPQVVFWLASLWLAYAIILKSNQNGPIALSKWIAFGLLTGCSVLCKVHGVFIWFGFGLYILFYQRALLKHYGLYVSALITLIAISPIVWWNIQNDFITYRFHSERVAVQDSIFHFDYLAQAIGGQIVYSNPVNTILIFIALWKLKSMSFLDRLPARFILLNGLPIILVVTGMSLFNSMLPHWSGPGFMVLAFLAASYLDEKFSSDSSGKFSEILKASIGLLSFSLIVALILINMYPGTRGSHEKHNFGDGDFTLDMYGWTKLGKEFKPWLDEQRKSGTLPTDIKIVSHKWFPAAHLEYYVATPSEIPMVGVGKVSDLHQYYWLNRNRPALQKGDSALCIIPSNLGINMEAGYLTSFASADLLHTFESVRGGKVVRYFYVYLLKDYQMNDEVHLK